MALPKIVFVREEKERDGTKFLTVGRNLEEIAPDDLNAPEAYGMYVLQAKHKIIKQVRRA